MDAVAHLIYYLIIQFLFRSVYVASIHLWWKSPTELYTAYAKSHPLCVYLIDPHNILLFSSVPVCSNANYFASIVFPYVSTI